MNMAVIVFWMSSVAIVAIGAGVLWTMIRDLLIDSRRK